jgi:hypothetical protein
LNKSVLNDNIDEILYYFRQGGYNVVIFEDLDRFEQTEIFTKLREINLLINQSKSIKEHVVFIYAVRDDIFKENERTKFFDFIIPVIPIVNFSNSSEILQKKREKESYSFSKELVDDVSIFLGDMRLLFNVTNEYHIYQKSLNANLSQDQLFAILVYKNLYPSDFTDLANNQGDLYKHIYRKKELIRDLIEKSDEQIQERENKIEELEKEKLKNIEELRKLYIFSFLDWYLSKQNGFSHFGTQTIRNSISEIVKNNSFSEFLSDKIGIYYFELSYAYWQNEKNHYVSKFNQENNNLSDFRERESKLKEISDGVINKLEKEIKTLRIKKEQAKRLSVAELIAEGEIEFGTTVQEKLISVLLRNGYVTENYIDCISIFHEVSMSRSDYEFLLNVKSQTENSNSTEIEQAGNLIDKINPLDFTRKYVFNFDLVNCLAKDKKNKNRIKKENLFKKLSDESEESITFVENYLNSEKVESAFLEQLFEVWKTVWSYIEGKSKSDSERKEKYFQFIIEHGTVESIKAIADHSDFTEYISSKKKFLNNKIGQEKIQKIIKSLEIFLEDIPQDIDDEMLKFIHEGSFHTIGTSIVKMILSRFDGNYSEELFNKKNYSLILKSNCKELRDDLETHIDSYVEAIFLSSSSEEEEDAFIKLLNNSNVHDESKSKIIKQMNTKVSDILSVKDFEIQEELMRYNKVKPVWSNVIHNYEKHKNTISQVVLDYLNNIENAKILSNEKIEKDEEGVKRSTNFIKTLLLNNEINDNVYKLLTKSSPYRFKNLSFGELSNSKIESLIVNGKLGLSTDNFDLAPTDKLKILFAERYTDEFITNIEDYTFSESFLKIALDSTAFTELQKGIITKSYRKNSVTFEKVALYSLLELSIAHSDFNPGMETLNALLLSNKLPDEKRIKLFVDRQNKFDSDSITQFIETLSEPYSEINNKSKRPTIPNTEVNRAFLKILESKGIFSSFKETEKGLKIWQNKQ